MANACSDGAEAAKAIGDAVGPDGIGRRAGVPAREAGPRLLADGGGPRNSIRGVSKGTDPPLTECCGLDASPSGIPNASVASRPQAQFQRGEKRGGANAPSIPAGGTSEKMCFGSADALAARALGGTKLAVPDGWKANGRKLVVAITGGGAP